MQVGELGVALLLKVHDSCASSRPDVNIIDILCYVSRVWGTLLFMMFETMQDLVQIVNE